MSEKAASTIVSAISLGVFWRIAPSTSAIILSRKLWPGSAVTCTTIRSDRTRVPPGAPEWSPPAPGDRAGGPAGPAGGAPPRLADHRGALAGDRALVDRGDPLNDLAVGG